MVCVRMSHNPQRPCFIKSVAGNTVAQQNCAVFGYLSPCRQLFSLLPSVFSASHSISSCGLSVSIVTRMGPNGDSAVSSEKEMCPANATCLFRQKLMVFPLMLRKSAFLAASRILSLRSILRSLIRGNPVLWLQPLRCLLCLKA